MQEDLACRGKLLGQQMKYSRTKGEKKWSCEDTEFTITKWSKSLAKKNMTLTEAVQPSNSTE